MTLTRKLAVRISEFAVRRASAESHEWAEGLAREVEVIDGDWVALRWAPGSLRVLFGNPPKPLRNAAEVARAGRLFAGSREHLPPILCLTMVLQASNYWLKVIFPSAHSSSLQRTGFAIAAVCAAYLAVVGWMEWRMSARPESMDDGAWIEFYRREMERRRDLFAGFGAFFVVAIVLFMGGVVLGLQGMAWPYFAPWMTAPCLFLAWLVPPPEQGFQQKLEQLDSILEQSEGGV